MEDNLSKVKKDLQVEVTGNLDKLVELEGHSRRNNVIINGMPKVEGEVIEDVVRNFMVEKLEIQPEVVDNMPMRDLEDPNIPALGNNFLTPCNVIRKKFEKYPNLLKFGHLNTRSVPKHLLDLEKTIHESDFDAFGACETFVTGNTPKVAYDISVLYFFSCR